MIPDFLDTRAIHYHRTAAYYQKAQGAYKLVDGMTLPNLLAGPAFDMLFREISVDKIEKESRALVGRVSSYIQTVVSKLFEGQCAHCPGLLRGIDTNLVGDFVKSKEAKAMEAVSNAVKAGFVWVFTMDPLYLRTITDVQKMVDSFRKGTTSRSQVDAVGKVTRDFSGKMADCESTSEIFAIHTLQVCCMSRQHAINQCFTMFHVISGWETSLGIGQGSTREPRAAIYNITLTSYM